ncbi:MAG: hypothetical protein V4732_13255 [Pseudomonadota bacterium]
MSYRTAIFLLVALFFTIREVNACSVVLSPKKIIEVTKIRGESNPNLKYLEAIGWLFYKGEEDLTIYSSKKNIIATYKRGILCTYNVGNSTCASKSGSYFDLSIYNPIFSSKKSFYIFMKFGNSEPIKYQFKRTFVKYKEEYDEQRYLAAFWGCPSDE